MPLSTAAMQGVFRDFEIDMRIVVDILAASDKSTYFSELLNRFYEQKNATIAYPATTQGTRADSPEQISIDPFSTPYPESVTLNSPTPQFTEIAQPQAPFHPGVLRIRPQASLRPPQSCLSPPLQHSIPRMASRLAPSGRTATQAPWGLLPRLVGSACLRARLRPPRRPHRADANGARTPQRPRHWPPGPAPTGGRGGSRGRP